MAVKGLGYTKTSWAFEERPVASSKLNSWDDRFEEALELVFRLLSLAWGGGDGVLRGATENDLAVVATSPAGMSVQVTAGYAFINALPYRLTAALETATVAAPASNPRIDLVQARLETWDVSIKTGTEGVSPTVPAADTDCIALAELYLRPGMASIKDSDDATNGYIADVRTFV